MRRLNKLISLFEEEMYDRKEKLVERRKNWQDDRKYLCVHWTNPSPSSSWSLP